MNICYCLFILSSSIISVLGVCNINSYGAISTDTQPDVSIANKNAAALVAAFTAANQNICNDRTIYVESLSTYYFTAFNVSK